MRNAILRATGSYVPANIIPNSYFDAMLGEDVSTWLVENLTIRERRWCDENESTADLAECAAREALRNAGIAAQDLDLLIVATDTPEFVSPSTASVVQYRIGARNAGTFDINTACAGFVTGLDVAAKFIRADDHYKHVLVIGAYAMSKYLNKADKKTVTLFADGAAAAVLSAEYSNKESAEGMRGYLASELRTQGQYYDWMGIYGGAARYPMTQDVLDRKDHLLRFVKKFPRELNPNTWVDMIRAVSKRASVAPENIQHYFFTQININSIRETMQRLDVPIERSHNIMERFGYTGSACIGMALDEAMQQEKIKPGDVLMFMGSGGGLAFASLALRF
ncbi:MAG: ketoacyl-ACP synthase III [Bacteroidota bacterium]|nr:ketoacyl-ACP synthase III [Candidatus Kapabacteria bacterium]MDW8218891.1 ketoacyl-ACP synthase III [Bacteroidota bacterium]